MNVNNSVLDIKTVTTDPDNSWYFAAPFLFGLLYAGLYFYVDIGYEDDNFMMWTRFQWQYRASVEPLCVMRIVIQLIRPKDRDQRP